MSDDIASRLKGLSKAQLREVERDVGVIRKARPNASAKSIIEAIDKHRVWAMYQAEAGELARQAGGGNLFIGKAKPDLTVGPKEAARFAKSLDDAVDKVKAASPAKPAATPKSRPTSPKAQKAPKPAVDVVGMAKRVESAIKSGDPKSIAAVSGEIKGAKLGKAAAHDLAKASGMSVAASASGKSAVERVLGRLGNMATHIAKSKAVGGRSAAGLALGLGVTAAMAMMGRSSSAEAKPATPAPAPSGPGMAMGVAKAARAAPAAPATGGGRRPAAAPDPSGKTRTEAYTDSMGRQYRNGRLIVRQP